MFMKPIIYIFAFVLAVAGILVFTTKQLPQPQTLVKPSSVRANSCDPLERLELLNLWAHQLANENQKKPMIFAGIGKPTYMLNKDIAIGAAKYWQTQLDTIAKAERLIAASPREQQSDRIVQVGSAIGYGHTAG